MIYFLSDISGLYLINPMHGGGDIINIYEQIDFFIFVGRSE